jgi:hypothetical protein
MKKCHLLNSLWISAFLLAATVAAASERRFAGGTGEPNTPYQIATAEQLIALGQDPQLLNRHFILVRDIDLDPNLPGGRVFTRAVIAANAGSTISPKGAPFTGSLDGDGHKISHLTMHCAGGPDIGLFGRIGTGGQVRNLGLCSVSIRLTNRSDYVGSLAGRSMGRIARCFAAGQIRGGEQTYGLGGLIGRVDHGTVAGCHADVDVLGHFSLGGLVGQNDGGEITCCYAMGDISGVLLRGARGGLIGGSSGMVTKCYATGRVAPGQYSEEFGGLIAGSNGGSVTHCFWDIQTSGLRLSHGGNGLTTTQMMNCATYSLNGWAGDPNWVLDDGRDYPRLAWEGKPGRIVAARTINWFAGSGIPRNPYIVATADQLALIGTTSILWNKHFVLACDLDVRGVDVPRIGIDSHPFIGVFDGKGHVIRNLTMDTGHASVRLLGLFGVIGGGGRVSHLALADVVIRGGYASESLGGLAGTVASGVITHCRVTGDISAGEDSQALGGLVGDAFDAVITDCRADCHISAGNGSKWLGGLAGYYGSVNAGIIHVKGTPGEIARCCATGRVSVTNGGGLIGGLIGYNLGGEVKTCYATGGLSGGTGGKHLGGFVGYNRDGRLSDCYATGPVTAGAGSSNLGGLIGFHQYGSVARCYAIGLLSCTDKNASIGGLIGDGLGEDFAQCFWDAETTGTANGIGGTGLITARMTNRQTYIDAGWDVAGEQTNDTANAWLVPDGGGYPRLTAFDPASTRP